MADEGRATSRESRPRPSAFEISVTASSSLSRGARAAPRRRGAADGADDERRSASPSGTGRRKQPSERRRRSEIQRWPPSGRRSVVGRARRRDRGRTRSPGRRARPRQSSGWAPPRSRHSAGRSAADTARMPRKQQQRHAVQDHRLVVGSVTGPANGSHADIREDVERAACKDGPLGLFPRPGPGVASLGTGRCDPRRANPGQSAVSNHARPAATTPRAAGLSFLGHSGAAGPRLPWPRGPESAPRLAARLLRRGRARRRDGGEGARALRAAGLRPQADRPQPRTSSATSRPAARSSSTRRPRCRPAQTVVFSAHGVAPSVHANAAARRLNTIDATCPLVTKVHVQARRYAAERLHGAPDRPRGPRGGRRHDGRGARRDRARRVGRGRRAPRFPAGTRLAYVTQTTLSVDETGEIITALRRRFPEIHAPKKEDICYATSNRQWAVKEMLGEIELLLVIGSRNSSNSNRLVEVARANGVASHLIDDETRDRRGMDRRRRRRRRHVRRLRAREARRARLRLVPRARRRRHRALSARRRGRRVPPAGRAPPRARARRAQKLGRLSWSRAARSSPGRPGSGSPCSRGSGTTAGSTSSARPPRRGERCG